VRTQQRSSKREECACERSRGPGMASWLLRVCFGLVGGRGKQLGETSWRVLASLSSPAASTRLGLERGEAEGRRAWEEQAASTQRKIPRVHAVWCVNTSNWWMRGCVDSACSREESLLAFALILFWLLLVCVFCERREEVATPATPKSEPGQFPTQATGTCGQRAMRAHI